MNFRSNIDAITQTFAPLEGQSLLDIGCGRGRLTRALVKRGANTTGIDPQAKMINLAKQAVPEATFTVAGGAALPFEDGTFDGAIILNSLHHIPENEMERALAEAIRVIKLNAKLLILEPLARGGYHEVFAPIDDEKEIRAVALSKLDAFIKNNDVALVHTSEFETMVPEESVETVLSGAVRVDPTRASLVEEKRAEVSRLFDKHVCMTERGPALDQPMIAFTLQKARQERMTHS